jgi:TolB-like protein/DNA-binding winged helix-turn-helix (wHTH) protein/Tfp pilus assembly protein PilF
MSERVRFGLFEFDTRTGELRREGDIVKLPPQPARVLALLVAKPGEVVLRDELRKELWGDETFVDFERGLNFCILQVRTALGDSSDNPRFVQTVPRRGYRFIAPVSRTSTQTPEQESPVLRSEFSVLSSAPVLRSPFSILRSGAVFAAAALLILAPLVWLAMGRRDTVPTPSANGRVRIAVLPFVNLTGDTDSDYIVDGVTDELIAQLGRVNPQRLGVIARTSVMRYRNNPDKSVADIGRELDVRYVIEGSIRREGGRLRVTTDLVKVSDQAQVWSDAFERPARDSIDLQTDLAVRVARALTIELEPGDVAPALPHPTTNADAWDAYLRGRQLMNRGNADDGRRSAEQFEEAVKLDPKFAAGWAQLAEAHHLLVMIGAARPHDAYPRAKEAADRALALDSTLADAHVASGLVSLWYEWKPEAAAQSFERALARNSSHGAAHHDYAWTLVGLGRFDEAVRHVTAARDYDPLSIRANADIGWLHLHLRQPTEAARACQHILALQPDALEPQACLERAYVQRGLYDEAVRAAQLTLPRNAHIVMPAAGNANGEDRMRAIWKWRLQRLEQASRSRYVSPHSLATHYVLIGDYDRALDALERSFEQRVGVLAFLKTDPLVDPLRSHPRFEALLRQVSASFSR